MIRKLLKILIKILLGIGVIFVLYLFAVLLGMIIPSEGEKPTQEGPYKVFVSTNGLHASFILPLTYPNDEWLEPARMENFPGVDSSFQHISFGWGDRDFYVNTPQWSDMSIMTTLRALFWPTPSIVQVTYWKEYRCDDESCIALALSEEQYDKLRLYISKTIAHSEPPVITFIPGSGYTTRDRFIEAKGNYSCFNTCNNWLNQGLKQMGIKTALWSPLDWGIFFYLKE